MANSGVSDAYVEGEREFLALTQDLPGRVSELASGGLTGGAWQQNHRRCWLDPETASPAQILRLYRRW